MVRALKRLVSYRRPVIIVIHGFLVAVAYLLAFLLRFEFDFASLPWKLVVSTFPLLIAIRTGIYAWFHVHEGLWRYVSMQDLLMILKATTVSSLLFAGSVLLVFDRAFPRSIFVLDWLLCLALVCGVRVMLRSLREVYRKSRPMRFRRALIVGAGDAAEMLIREIERNPALNYTVLGLVDDDQRKRGRRIHGIEVLGTIDQLPALSSGLGIEEILIAVPAVRGAARQRILQRCGESELPFKSVPAMNELLLGKARIGQLQEVRVEDLLGREAVRLDLDQLRRELRGRRIMVTGAAGSIGSELCRQLATFEPEMLILLDRGESSLYFVDLELKNDYPSLKIVAVVGDILDSRQVGEVIQSYAPEIIYHAAAYKHVPLVEEYPLEGITNNVFGTEVVLRAALQNGVKKLVLISTAKAVRPVGVMGMTKRVAEALLQMHSENPTVLVAVRFGNVLGSDGSVLPLFQRQIARGGPITVTDPAASRYFMLSSEAVPLVLQAGALAKGGEIFFLDMGEPVRSLDLAQNLARLSGLVPEKDIAIKVIGLRPGERLREELVMDDEHLLPTEHRKVFMVRSRSFNREDLRRDLEELRCLVEARDRVGSVALLKGIASRY